MNPSRAQLRMLHILSRGRLVFHRAPRDFQLWIFEDEAKRDLSYRFHPKTARIVVERGWAELKRFNPQRGEYEITSSGLSQVQELCRHSHEDAQTTEKLSGRMLCRKCARQVRCVSVKSEPHAADRWHWKWGPVCEAHAELVRQKKRA